jgi:hypothetical protein
MTTQNTGRTDHDAESTVAVHHSGTSSCGSYGAGHDPHWIQVLRVAPRGTPVAVRDVRLVDPVSIELDVDTVAGTVGASSAASAASGRETLVVRNHDAVQVAATWQRIGEGRLVHGASLLQIGPESGMASFSVTGGELSPCVVARGDAGGDATGGAR